MGMTVDQTDEESIKRAAQYVVENEDKLPPYFISALNITSKQHVRFSRRRSATLIIPCRKPATAPATTQSNRLTSFIAWRAI
jgi:hypothetical protein